MPSVDDNFVVLAVTEYISKYGIRMGAEKPNKRIGGNGGLSDRFIVNFKWKDPKELSVMAIMLQCFYCQL